MFIAFEGIDGSGKSTQACMLKDRLGSRALLHSFPSRFENSNIISHVIAKDISRIRQDSLRAASLLHMADIALTVDTRIKPALESGEVVICDRYIDSGSAYQTADGLNTVSVAESNFFACDNLFPDIVFLIDIPVEIAMRRIKKRGNGEYCDYRYLRDVRATYLEIAQENETFIVVDGTMSKEDISNEIWNAILEESLSI